MTITEFKNTDFEYKVLDNGDFIYSYYLNDSDIQVKECIDREKFLKYCKKNIDGFDYNHCKELDTSEILDCYLIIASSSFCNEYYKLLLFKEYSNDTLVKKDKVNISALEMSIVAALY